MTPYWHDDHLTLYGGDCRAVLAELPAESVHCVVTSPPYWGLRDYGTASWDGGDEACDHKETVARHDGGRAGVDGFNGSSHPSSDKGAMNYRATCRKCGALRIDSQLGLEATPEAYVESMVAVFREVRRVLRADGTLWLNLGDSYAGGGGFSPDAPSNRAGAKQTTMRGAPGAKGVPVTVGLKPKDLVGIPWRVAFALQADGWYLRSDIIWSKPNPMPESVTDRPTKAHEYLFLLAKSPRYYYDAEAVREAGTKPAGADATFGKKSAVERLVPRLTGNMVPGVKYEVNGQRNLRSVWTIATEPYPGAHFATFPRKLVEPCVKAGTSERGVCPECGAPWERVGVSHIEYTQRVHNHGKYPEGQMGHQAANRHQDGHIPGRKVVETTGWRSSCTHDAEPVPAVVLDPFAGSGTTLLVAQALGRRGIGIDLSPEYLKQALARNAQTPLGLVG